MIVHSPEGLSPLINPAANAEVEALFTDITQPQAPLEHRLSPEELERYGLESPPPPAPTEPFFCLLPGSENKLPDLQFTVGSDELVDKIRARNAQQEVLTNPTVIPTVMPPEPIFPPTSTPPPKQQEKPTTEVEVQAVAEVPKKQELPSWAKPYFYYKLPAWGVDVNKLNPSEKLEIKDKLGSGRYFFDGKLSDLIQTNEKQHQYLTAYRFQLTGSRFDVAYNHGTKQKIDAYIESRFKDASPAEIAALKQRNLALAEAFMNEFRDKEGIHMKTTISLQLQKYYDTVEWTVWQTDGKSLENAKFLGILNIPIP